MPATAADRFPALTAPAPSPPRGAGLGLTLHLLPLPIGEIAVLVTAWLLVLPV